MKKLFFLNIFMFSFVIHAFTQNYIEVQFSQSSELQAFAGNDITISSGNSEVIGGNPSASGGTEYYTFFWQPANGLSSNNIANPIVSVTETTLYTLTVVDANGCSSTDDILVTVSNSINNIDYESISVVLNRTKEKLTIQFDQKLNFRHLTIFDVQGKIVCTMNLNNRNCADVDVSGFSKSVYILKLESDNSSISRQFIYE